MSVEPGTESGTEVERVYREDGARLWRALFAFSGDRDVASDAMAEAFAQALGRGEAVHDHRRWVWRAAFRLAAGELQRRRRLEPERDAPYEPALPDDSLLRALARLSPKQRAAMILRFYAGYPTREVARILGSSAATVRVHLSQGRRRLRALLDVERDDG